LEGFNIDLRLRCEASFQTEARKRLMPEVRVDPNHAELPLEENKESFS